jgi:Peptidase inhibitor family I36
VVLITAVVGVELAYGGGQVRWGIDPMPQAGVCFFDDTNFRGQHFCVGRGQDLAQLPPGMNDQISSIQVIGNVEVTVFKDTRFNGASGRFFGGCPRSSEGRVERPDFIAPGDERLRHMGQGSGSGVGS